MHSCALGLMQKIRHEDSGLMSGNKEKSPTGSTNNSFSGKCFYCGQAGHVKKDCSIFNYHQSKGLMLVNKDKTQQAFNRFNQFAGRSSFNRNNVNWVNRGRGRPNIFQDRGRIPRGNLRIYNNNSRGRVGRPAMRTARRFNKQSFRVFSLQELGAIEDEDFEKQIENQEENEELDQDQEEENNILDEDLFEDSVGQIYSGRELEECEFKVEVPQHIANAIRQPTVPLSEVLTSNTSHNNKN